MQNPYLGYFLLILSVLVGCRHTNSQLQESANSAEVLAFDYLPLDRAILEIPGLRKKCSMIRAFAEKKVCLQAAKAKVESLSDTLWSYTSDREPIWLKRIYALKLLKLVEEWDANLAFHLNGNEKELLTVSLEHEKSFHQSSLVDKILDFERQAVKAMKIFEVPKSSDSHRLDGRLENGKSLLQEVTQQLGHSSQDQDLLFNCQFRLRLKLDALRRHQALEVQIAGFLKQVSLLDDRERSLLVEQLQKLESQTESEAEEFKESGSSYSLDDTLKLQLFEMRQSALTLLIDQLLQRTLTRKSTVTDSKGP